MIIEKQGSQSKIVPRNWAQQVGPYLELLHTRLDLDLPEQRFHYGVRLCPEPAHWGGAERLHLSEIMSQPWLRLSKNGFWDLFALGRSAKVSVLGAHPLIGGMKARFPLGK